MYLTYRFRAYPDQKQSALLDDKFCLARTAYNKLVSLHQASLQTKSLQSETNQPVSAQPKAIPSNAAEINTVRPDTVRPNTVQPEIIQPDFSPNTSSRQILPPVGCSCDHFADQLLKEANRYELTDRSIVINAVRSFARNRDQAFRTKTVLKYKTTKNARQVCRFIAKDQLIQIGDNSLQIRMLGPLKTSITRKILGNVITITISKTTTGRYYICLLAKKTDSKRTLLKTMQKKSLKIVGIDMGIKHFIILSDGTKYANPMYMEKQINKLQHHHRQLSSKEKNSKNRDKARLRLARHYEHIYNQRNGFLQQLSTELIRKYDIIAVESLNIKQLMHKSPRARKIADAAWRQFILMLQYKAGWYGKIIIQIPQYLPSSKKCCRCNAVNRKLTLKDREWTCAHCNTSHDRDINAAINILIAGTRQMMKEWPAMDPAVLKPVLSDKR